MDAERVFLITGASKGLGFETAKQLARLGHQVIVTARDATAGEKATAAMKAEGLHAHFLPLDVSASKSIEECFISVDKQFGRLDGLVNNAGVFPDRSANDSSAQSATRENILRAFEINTLGAFETCQRAIPLMIRGKYGRIVNVSSGMGQLSEMNGQWPAYRISKTALNAVTKIFADELAGSPILVNSVCPGWVKTDMGGSQAPRSVQEGADGIVWLATLPPGGPSGGFFRDRAPIAW